MSVRLESAWHCGRDVRRRPSEPGAARADPRVPGGRGFDVWAGGGDSGCHASWLPAGSARDRPRCRRWRFQPGRRGTPALGGRRWEAHRGAGLTLCPELPELREGLTMVQAVPLPLISAVAACRIVYVVEEPNAFGFAYGTLPAHPEEGEEAFIVHRDSQGPVSFVITAFSRPRHPLARLGGPATRQIQLRVTKRYLHGLKAFATG